MRSSLLAALSAVAIATVPVTALADHRRAPPPPEGRVVVENRSGGTVSVSIAGRAPMRLQPWAEATLYAPAGEATVRATYDQFGASRLLESERVHVDPSRTRRVVIDPEDQARVLVTNDTPWPATLEVNDRYHSRLDPFEHRVVTVPVGRVELELVADGREIEEKWLDARPFVEHRWTVRREATGTFVAVNPFGVRVEFVDARGAVRTAEPYARVVYAELPAGSFRVTARRVTDEPIDSEYVTITPGRTIEWRPEPPREGLVSVDNHQDRAVRLVVDGETVRTLRGEEDVRLSLDLGWHRVAARDDAGRLLLDTWIEVEPFDVARVSLDAPQYVAEAEEHEHGAHCHH
ncbi:MAG: hypothetical protein ACOZNI_32240 [Myxococcota bacterium]